jgi:hypothetical protein
MVSAFVSSQPGSGRAFVLQEITASVLPDFTNLYLR